MTEAVLKFGLFILIIIGFSLALHIVDDNFIGNTITVFDIPDKEIRDSLLKNEILINSFCIQNGYLYGSTKYIRRAEYYTYQSISDIGVICIIDPEETKLYEGEFYNYAKTELRMK